MIAIATQPILSLKPAALNYQPDGLTVTVSNPDGTVVSVQEDGRIETRPAGTNGPFELAIKSSKGLVYAPRGNEGAVYVIPFVEEIPNT